MLRPKTNFISITIELWTLYTKRGKMLKSILEEIERFDDALHVNWAKTMASSTTGLAIVQIC